jgi:hypothetical protein
VPNLSRFSLNSGKRANPFEHHIEIGASIKGKTTDDMKNWLRDEVLPYSPSLLSMN